MNEVRRQLLRAGAGALAFGAFSGRAHAGGADAIVGTWVGTLALPQGGDADYALRIARVPSGALVVHVTIPAMHAFDAAIAEVEPLSDTRFRLDPFGTAGVLDGDRLTGEFAYLQVPFVLRRAAALPAWSETPEAGVPPAPAPRWTRTLPGAVWASPAARDGVAYLGDAAGNLHALHVRDGSTLWTYPHGTPIYGDACTDGGGITFVDERGVTCRVDRTRGRLRWRVEPDAATGAAAGTADFTFNHRTPRATLAGATLYVGSRDGSIRALDVGDGRVHWRRDVGGAVMSGIAVTEHLLVAGTFERNGVVALDRRDGRVAWTFATAQPVSSTPAVAGDTVLAGCRDFGIHGLALATGQSRWVNSYLFSWVESSPVITAGAAFFGASDLRCIRAVDVATGRTRYSTDVRGLTWGTPALHGDRLYAGTAGQTDVLIAHRPGLVALDRRSGALLWRRELPMGNAKMAGIAGSPCVAGRTLLAAAVDGTVEAFDI